MTDSTPGWQPDPTGRHEHRYWDGTRWTDHVADAGVASDDAYAPAGAAPPPPPPTDPTGGSPGWADPTATTPPPPVDPTVASDPTPAPPVDPTLASDLTPPPPVDPTLASDLTPPPPVDPTIATTPPPPPDPTTAWGAPPPVPPAGAPGPAAPDPGSSGSGGSRRGFLIGAGILAVVVAAVAGFLLLGGDDDDDESVETRLAAQIESESDGAVSEADAACLARHVVDEVGEDELADVDFSDDSPPANLAAELTSAMFDALESCEVDAAALQGDAVDENDDDDSDDSDDGGTYGSDPELDALYDECEDGDFQACDDLFLAAPSGSEYEDFGDTCGERNEPAGYCTTIHGEGDEGTDGIDVDTETMRDTLADIYEDSMGLEREKAECLAGKLADAIESGELSEEEAMSDVFSFLQDCDISMDELGTPSG